MDRVKIVQTAQVRRPQRQIYISTFSRTIELMNFEELSQALLACIIADLRENKKIRSWELRENSSVKRHLRKSPADLCCARSEGPNALAESAIVRPARSGKRWTPAKEQMPSSADLAESFRKQIVLFEHRDINASPHTYFLVRKTLMYYISRRFQRSNR